MILEINYSLCLKDLENLDNKQHKFCFHLQLLSKKSWEKQTSHILKHEDSTWILWKSWLVVGWLRFTMSYSCLLRLVVTLTWIFSLGFWLANVFVIIWQVRIIGLKRIYMKKLYRTSDICTPVIITMSSSHQIFGWCCGFEP